ncbi:MAG: prepilin-type N-terminal cleavage/methylation domain-containing protein [Erysipelotrichaceae bacterium]|nr:prepilin-type N-terminal cleavage/methylation domain-containing protein [Erysipelotrichaceae bacterium]
MRNNGFTLIEMLVVLLMMCILLLWLPKLAKHPHAMHYHMEALRYRLIEIQEQAQTEKKVHKVTFHSTSMRNNDRQMHLPIQCNGTIVFHENGNVDQAKTITCTYQGVRGELVILLGNGRMYVK